MKKLLNFILLNLGLNSSLETGEILHVRKDKLKELNKDFRDSMNFLRVKNQQIMEERANRAANYQAKASEFENKKDLSQKEKDELERLEIEFQNLISAQNEELYKASLVFENKINSDIKEALKKLITDVPVIEGQIVLYGGKDITKELLEVLNNKDAKKIATNFNSKIYSFDVDQFNSKYKGVKDIKKYIDQKLEEIKNKQKEFQSKENDKDFNYEEAEKTIRNMYNELQTTNQVMQEKIMNDVENALSIIASSKKIDLVVVSKVVYSNIPSITDEVIKELEKDQDSKNAKKDNNSLVGFISYETLMTKYKKQEEKRKELENKIREFEKDLEDKANQIQKVKDNDKNGSKKAEIDRLENEYDQLRAVKAQQYQQLSKSIEDEILNDIKIAAKIVGNKKKLELIVFKTKSNSAVLYAGQDVTQDVLNILSNR